MYRIGGVELKRVERLFGDGRMFRYREKGECDRFEAAWGKRLGVKYVRMTTSGTSALYAALVGMKVGPGDEVIVPACTYMATALAVLAAGAIPIVADVDTSITLSAKDLERRITPATRAVIPVHMWGLPCDYARGAETQAPGSGGRVPGGRWGIRGEAPGIDRPRGGLQLQLLQEYVER